MAGLFIYTITTDNGGFMSILNVEHLSHGFGDRAIFTDVSFRLLKGEHIGLVGANGEGKSTFMNIITGSLMPDEGKIEWAKNVRVITPDFQVWKGGKLKTVVIYAKMCRGEMVRYIIKNRIGCPEDLRGFSWEGFTFDEELSTDNHLQFVLE